MSTFYGLVTAARDELHTRIEEITWLSGKVYNNAWRTDTVFPCVLLEWVGSSMVLEKVSPPTYRIELGVALVFRDLGATSGSGNYDLIVSGAGAVIDKIRAYTTNYSGGVYWEKAVIGDVEFSYVSPGVSPLVVGEAKIPVTLVREW